VNRTGPLAPEIVRAWGQFVGRSTGAVSGRRRGGARAERNKLFSGPEPVARQPHDRRLLSPFLASLGLPAFPHPVDDLFQLFLRSVRTPRYSINLI
jgi:hypothetical protein